MIGRARWLLGVARRVQPLGAGPGYTGDLADVRRAESGSELAMRPHGGGVTGRLYTLRAASSRSTRRSTLPAPLSGSCARNAITRGTL